MDVVLSGGEAVYTAVTDNWPTHEPYFLETGSNCPSILPAYQQAELVHLAVASVKVRGPPLGAGGRGGGGAGVGWAVHRA